MVIDRTQVPAYQAIHEVRLPAVDTHRLDNSIPLHLIAVQQQPVLRLEIILEAGTQQERQAATAFFALKMLAEGTATRSSAQISEYLDSYGAFLEINNGADRSSLVVYCLTKFLPNVLPVVCDLLTEPTFPQKELDDLRNITLQNLRVNLEKNSYLAGVMLRETLFGREHPYGRSQTVEALEQISREAVVAFYERVIRNRPFQLLVAGQASLTEVALINQTLGQLSITDPVTPLASIPLHAIPEQPILVEKEASLQSSIRIGRRLFTRQHPDFFPMLVTNEVLGGYFGSRLMKNIREEKGFTYGISSNLVSFRKEGYFIIGTDVKKEYTQQTLDEIRKEIERLRVEPVPADELDTVKNYMAGEFVGSLNTPFEIADRYKVILLDGLPADFLAQYIDRVRSVSPDDIQRMINHYLQPDSLLEVVVGGK